MPIAARKTIVGLILAATVLFVIGIALERNSGESGGEPAMASVMEGQPAEGGALGGEESESGGGSGHEVTRESGDESDEQVLGINLESTPFVILAVIGSLGLAALVWLGRAPWLLLLVAAAMLAFAIFDIAEVFHQIDRSEAGIAIVAALVAALHLSAGFASARLRRQPAG